ncbi:DUF6119 family protein [Streptomyces bluensis]|uniref:DUF6119 family protein n=1 Tax=Streptomyces bluensis TaxID=33897 RepID=UPI00368C3875
MHATVAVVRWRCPSPRDGRTPSASVRRPSEKRRTPMLVVFAILLKSGTELTADTLFPFSRVTLVQTAKMLEAWGVAVEVIGIQATTVPASGASIRRLAA